MSLSMFFLIQSIIAFTLTAVAMYFNRINEPKVFTASVWVVGSILGTILLLGAIAFM